MLYHVLKTYDNQQSNPLYEIPFFLERMNKWNLESN